MKIAVRIAPEQEAEAVGILYRHAPGTVLPDHTYVIERDAVERLLEEGIAVTMLSVTDDMPSPRGELIGERV